MVTNVDCDFQTPDDLNPTFVHWVSRLSFFVLCPISSYFSFLLIIGYIKYKNLKERPGDIILAIALNNFIITIYWVLALIIPALREGWGCRVGGVLYIFSSMINYSYNFAFLFYLNQKMKNLLKQARITTPAKVHFLCLLISFAFTAYSLLEHKEIGPNVIGVCAIRFSCNPSIVSGVIIVLFYISYALFAFRLYYYIKKSFAEALASSNGAERFLANYRGFILITIVFWLGVALGLVWPAFTADSISLKTDIISFIANICAILQNITLAIYRVRDPLIKRAMRRLICFWNNERELPSTDRQAFIANATESTIDMTTSELLNGSLQPLLSPQNKDPEDRTFSEQTNSLEGFSTKRKLELTYSILSSILVVYSENEESGEKGSTMSEGEGSYAPSMFEVHETTVFEKIPNAKTEMQTAKCQLIPARLESFATKNFRSLIKENIGIEVVRKSLDLKKNRNKILQDNAGNGGKSGEFFFFSADNKLIIKTISDKEAKALIKLLPSYHEYLKARPNTLLIKIYGVFKLEWQYQTINLIVMGNVAPYPTRCIEKRFDLKGSTYTRQVLKENQYHERKLIKTLTMKDIDFLVLEQTIKVSPSVRVEILETLKDDLDFLSQFNFMDYSFILFIVNKKRLATQRDSSVEGDRPTRMSVEPKWPSLIPMEGEPDYCYSLGIIDFLQKYTLTKKIEKNMKKVIHLDPSLNTSAQNPMYYKERFWDFINQILDVKHDESL